MQSFASYASITLHKPSGDACQSMTKRDLPDRKTPADGIPAVGIFRRNVRALMDAAKESGQEISQEIIADAAGISLRTLAHHLSVAAEDKSSPTLRTVQAVSDAFGLSPWLLLTEDLPAELVLSPHVRKTVQHTISRYLKAPQEAREVIDKTVHLLPRRMA
jgi:transcriptional regulator with XRE-family HTH domain